MIRIVGLSATLPNYKDVGAFLGVNVDTGLFYFDASYRPVPLEMQFVGVTEKNLFASKGIMDDVCYDKVSRAYKPKPFWFWGYYRHRLLLPTISVSCAPRRLCAGNNTAYKEGSDYLAADLDCHTARDLGMRAGS